MPPNSFTFSLVAVVAKAKTREREREISGVEGRREKEGGREGQWAKVVLEGLSQDYF